MTFVYGWDAKNDVGREQTSLNVAPGLAGGNTQHWTERFMQCVPMAAATPEERDLLAADANDAFFGPLERAIAGCFRSVRVA